MTLNKPKKISSDRFKSVQIGSSLIVGIKKDDEKIKILGLNMFGELGLGD